MEKIIVLTKTNKYNVQSDDEESEVYVDVSFCSWPFPSKLFCADEEKAAYQGILDEYDNMVAEFKEVYPNLIKDDLGAALYNKVRNAMKSDAELKTKYDELLASMQSTDEGDSETDDGGSN